MTSGLVDVGYSLPKGQAGKLIFFAPWGHVVFCLQFCTLITNLKQIEVFYIVYVLFNTVEPVPMSKKFASGIGMEAIIFFV